MAKEKQKRCRTKRCQNPAKQLGVCMSCYSVIRRAVLLEQITWDEAEDRGLVERTRKPSPMQDELAAIIGEKHDRTSKTN